MTTEELIEKLRLIADKHRTDGLYTSGINLSNICDQAANKLETLTVFETMSKMGD